MRWKVYKVIGANNPYSFEEQSGEKGESLAREKVMICSYHPTGNQPQFIAALPAGRNVRSVAGKIIIINE